MYALRQLIAVTTFTLMPIAVLLVSYPNDSVAVGKTELERSVGNWKLMSFEVQRILQKSKQISL